MRYTDPDQIAARKRDDDERLAAEVFEQHRASLPAQPLVDRLRPPTAVIIGRRTAGNMYREAQ